MSDNGQSTPPPGQPQPLPPQHPDPEAASPASYGGMPAPGGVPGNPPYGQPGPSAPAPQPSGVPPYATQGPPPYAQPGQPLYGQPGQPPYGQHPPYRQPGQPPYGQHPPYGQPGQPPYGQAGSQPYPGAPGGAGYTGYPGLISPQPTPGGGLAVAALIVGIGAFLIGWMPIIGGAVAIAGLVLGILVVRKGVRRGFGWAAIGLSAAALLASIATTLLLVLGPAIWRSEVGLDPAEPWPSAPATPDSDEGYDESDFSIVDGQAVETPCWSYDGPLYFVNNIDDASVEDCVGKLELWGEWQGDVFVATGTGSTAGQILVDPQLTTEVEALVPGSDVDAFVDAIEKEYLYFSSQGEILSLHEEVMIGGMPANITRLDSNVDDTRTKAFITVRAPYPYDTPSGEAQMFIISVTTPYSNGEEQIQQLLDTWVWK